MREPPRSRGDGPAQRRRDTRLNSGGHGRAIGEGAEPESCWHARARACAANFCNRSVGCGATLLYLLLNQHPDIALLYESDLPLLWPMFHLPWERKGWVNKWEYWNASISRHDLDPAHLSSSVKSLAEAFEATGRQYAAQRGKKRWGCKSPSYLYRLEQWAAEFPHAQFVVLWRDPEESCRSAIDATASGASGMWFARRGMTHRVILASQILKKQVDSLLSKGASVCQIHYRDLVGDTKNSMRGICEFLQVPFDPAVTVLSGADRSAVFKGAHHALARGNTIVSTSSRHAVLPPKLVGKIERYKALWKAESGDTWLLTWHFPENSSAKPTLWEQATRPAVTCGTASPGYYTTDFVFDFAVDGLANVSQALP